MPEAQVQELLSAIRALTEQVSKLEARMAALEARTAPEIPEETLAMLSAVIAAYLGKRPRIRQVRLVGSAAWSQQGRVGVHTSHAINVQHS